METDSQPVVKEDAVIIQFKRIALWLKLAFAPTIGPETSSAGLLQIDPSWHGDHWQNLLASPMDARRYVMEDWAVPLGADVVEQEEEKATA
ncbi:hypothetical protein [Caballeronia sp. GAWG2-1]|uniref:hypothetical protein n=1 Tax=Caballeronia sp. GAWG2-1 TaxID=2921744 RepID=UPI002028AB14|nr:hypothetical protein [Caballeronia sp. GAWG2-1]